MLTVLILTTTLNAAPPPGCAASAYCMAEAQQAFFGAWPHGVPAKLTDEERPVYGMAAAMEAEGCAVPEGRLRCPAAMPVDYAALGLKEAGR